MASHRRQIRRPGRPGERRSIWARPRRRTATVPRPDRVL